MSCFDIDNTTGRTNRNETNHFHIVLIDDLYLSIDSTGRIDTTGLSVKEYGVFLHEYIHYLQHILTLFGLNVSKMYNAIYRKNIEYLVNHDVINIPLKLTESDNGIRKYDFFYRSILGTQKYLDHPVDAVEVSDEAINEAKRFNRSVKVGIYDFENNEAVNNAIEFGYWSIIESMSHMIQSIVDPDVDNRHETVPYRVVELVCENRFKDIAKDKRMMITLCMCSLMFNNPGVAFFDMANYVLKNNIENGIILYYHVINDFTIQYKNKVFPLNKAISLFLEELVDSIESVIGIKVDYLNRVVNSCKREANLGCSNLINMIYDENIDFTKESIFLLGECYGYPLIQAENTIVLPNKNTKSFQPYTETAALLGFEILYKRITAKDSTKCPWFHVCSQEADLSAKMKDTLSTNRTTYECLCDQWNKKETCLMTQVLKFYHLDSKTFIQH